MKKYFDLIINSVIRPPKKTYDPNLIPLTLEINKIIINRYPL